MIIICDIDGTIADCTHRVHFIESEPKDWDSFYGACDKDGVYRPIRALLQIMSDLFAIYYVSGRRESTRYKTVQFLDNNQFPHGPLFLRGEGDYREDTEVKREILYKDIYREAGQRKEDVLFVLEDRASVVKMWREEGLTCLQVKEGDY